MIRLRPGDVTHGVSARFAQNLRALRDRAGLEPRDLATRLGLKDSSTISHWESGRILPAPRTVTTLAAALRCSTADLLAGVVTPYDALRGRQELPGPALLLSDEETGLVTTWRTLDPVVKTALREALLPALAAVAPHTRRRRGHGRRRRRAPT
jgi:transcriptional regulator with XRE-family HTH domain